jgi:hypothetical protein
MNMTSSFYKNPINIKNFLFKGENELGNFDYYSEAELKHICCPRCDQVHSIVINLVILLWYLCTFNRFT